jgi:hypothetical protein
LPRFDTEKEFDMLGVYKKLLKYIVHSSELKYWKINILLRRSGPNNNQQVPSLQVFYGLKNRTTSSSHCTMPKAAMAITWPHYKLRCSYTSLTPNGLKAIFRPFLKFGQAIVKAIFIKN